MTEEILLASGYNKYPAKIGTLYIKSPFFCTLNKDGIVDYRSERNDMVSLGKASTMEEIKELELEYYRQRLVRAKLEVSLIEKIIEGYDNKND